MGKKKKLVLPPHKLALRYAKHEIKPFRKAVVREVDMTLRVLFDKRYSTEFKQMLANQAIVIMVSGIEYYNKHFVRKIIDENKIDVKEFFDEDINAVLKDIEKKTGKKITPGRAFSMSFDFANPKVINDVMSRLFGLAFFETLMRLDDDKDSFKFHKRARSMHANLPNFLKMFEKRNNIVHALKRYEVRPTQLRSLAENTYFYTENLSIFYGYYENLDGRLGFYVSPNSQYGRWYRKIDETESIV